MPWDRQRATEAARHRLASVKRQLTATRASLVEYRRAHPDLVRRAVLGSAVALVLVLFSAGGYVYWLSRGLPSPSELGQIGEMDQATAVYDANDQVVFTIFKEQRIDVPLERVSPAAIDAILAIEDQRFYSHHGFDWIRIGSAFLTNIRRGRVTQGASTITQQLARMSFLTPDKTINRKLQELMLARRIETLYSKRDILQFYLNKAYFGDGLYGIEAASRGYFGKSASEVSVSEAALLAGLVKSPSSYAPTVRLDRAVARRNVVLGAMRDSGKIDRQQWEQAKAAPVKLQDGLDADESFGQYFKEQVRLELVERFGWQRVYQGGLRVYSTIDPELQRAAEQSVAEGLKVVEERRAKAARRRAVPDPADNGAPLQAALVTLDPHTGHVRAMVGGRDFSKSHFNRAMQARRQPGSAFKPFVYAAALEAGFSPATVISNLNDPIDTLQGAWTPEDGHADGEAMTMRAALRTSSNRAAVRMLQEVGIPETVRYAKTMGVGNVPSVPSLALGSGEVTLQSMTAAYAGFANKGSVPTPLLVRRVEDRNGQVLFTAQEHSTPAVSETTAYLMSTMMADVINAGTAAGARSLGFTLPAAGKTGTTNDYHDAWFIGYTPSIVTGVWVGFDTPKPIMANGYAADVAVPMWASFMKAATKGDKPEWFRAPAGIVSATVCRLSGLLASEGCEHADHQEPVELDGKRRRPYVYTELFARGTEPTSYCTVHALSSIEGAVATAFTVGDRPAAPHFEDHRIAPPPPVVAEAAEESAAPVTIEKTPDAPKKRGFWSRVFGVGRDRDKQKADDRDRRDER